MPKIERHKDIDFKLKPVEKVNNRTVLTIGLRLDVWLNGSMDKHSNPIENLTI